MKNIAILVGISKYKNAAPLPACSIDVDQMRALLQATGKYEDIQCLTDNTSSTQVKDAMREFFTRHRSSPINEAFVYFSGHGVFHGDALLCCSDFDPKRPSSTSISNKELDDLLRNVSPEVAVKIIDACQSGSPYIKDASAGFEKAFNTSELKGFICMASSRLDQASYATADASAFTEKWIDAALQRTDGTVLYRDIQAALADAFVNTPEQTPFFVNQGTGLEFFASVTDDMKRLADKRIPGVSLSDTKDALLESLLIEINRQDNYYVSQQDAWASVEAASTELETSSISDAIVCKLYTKRVSAGAKLGTLPRIDQVAAFAEEQGWPKNYFTRIIMEEYKAKVRQLRLSDMVARHMSISRSNEPEYTIETKMRPASLETIQPLPFEVAEVHFEAPNHPSLRSFVLFIGIVHSLTDVMVLSSIIRHTQKGWNERVPEISEMQWKYQNYKWSDITKNPKNLVADALANAEATVRSYLHSLLPKQDLLPSADAN